MLKQFSVFLLTLVVVSGELHGSENYEFGYGVHDAHTGDIKTQHEVKHGDHIDGQYSLIEPDGNRRIVEYHADDHNGFKAVVHHEGLHLNNYAQHYPHFGGHRHPHPVLLPSPHPVHPNYHAHSHSHPYPHLHQQGTPHVVPFLQPHPPEPAGGPHYPPHPGLHPNTLVSAVKHKVLLGPPPPQLVRHVSTPFGYGAGGPHPGTSPAHH